jgi:hypothetical protein
MITIGIVLIVLILVIFYSYKIGQRNAELSCLRGFYESSKEFNGEAGISSFTFYVGDYCGGSYNTYILMVGNDDDKILVNSPSPMTLSSSWFGGSELDCYEFKANFLDLNSDFMPNNMTFKFYPRSSKIILSGLDTVYGCLFKNNILSEMDIIKDECLHNQKNRIKKTESKKPNQKKPKQKNRIKNLESKNPEP